MDKSNLLGDAWRYDPEYHKVADFLGVNKYDREDSSMAEKLDLIYSWAQIQNKGTSKQDVMWALFNLKKELGLPVQGKLLVDELNQYVRLQMDSKRSKEIEQEKKDKRLEPKVKKEEPEEIDVKEEHEQ